MMATPHLLTGAAIGAAARRPWLAYPLALASHFFLDWIPHLDSHALFGTTHGGPTPLEAVAGVSDLVVGIVVVGVLTRGRPDAKLLRWAALLAVLTDLIEYAPSVGPWLQSWSSAAWYVHFHHGVQHNLRPSQWLLGFTTQGAVVIASLAVLWQTRAHQSKRSA